MARSMTRRSFAALLGSSALLSGHIAAQTTGSASETGTKLPAADLPSMNQQGHRFEFSSTFSGDFGSVPVQSPVYRMEQISYSADDVQHLAERLNVTGEVSDLGGDTFTVQSRDAQLFVTQGRVQYMSLAPSGDGDLPDDTRAIGTAREWLREHSLLPGNVGDGKVLARSDEPRRVVIGFPPAKPSPIISSTPLVTVSLGPGNQVLEAANSWATLTQDVIYQLRGADNAWNEVEARRAWIDASLPTDQFAPGTTIGGSVVYTKLSLAYTTSGVPGENQYLQPVYVFHGELTPDGTTDVYQVQAFVAALINSNQPVG